MNNYKKYLVLTILFLFPLFAQADGQNAQTFNDSPIKVSFINNSSHTITVNVLSMGNVADMQALAPGAKMELSVDQGNRIRLDYEPCPKQSLLSPLGSLNELTRSITIRDDGKSVFIQERFAGQLNKGKGQKRSRHQSISEPDSERPQFCGEKPENKNQNMDPNQPKQDRVHITRVEDPAKPAPKEKIKKNTKKLKEKETKKLDKKEKK